MKRKALVFLIAAMLAIAVLPAGFAGAAQGTLAYVQPASTFTQSTGFANTDQSGTNVVKFRITDTDLNTNKALTGNLSTLTGVSTLSGKGLILGVGDGSKTLFTVDSSVTPVIAPVLLAQDLQSGTGYLAAIGGAGSSITLLPVPADIPSGDTAAGAVTAAEWEIKDQNGITTAVTTDQATTAGSFAGASLIRATVVDAGGSTASDQNIVLKGTSVNPVTLVQTAADTETLVFAGNGAGGTETVTSTKVFLPAGLTFQTVGTTSEGYRLRLQQTRTIVVNFNYGVFNDTDSGAGSTASPFAQTVKVISTTNSTGLTLSVFETDTTTENASKTAGTFQRVVANDTTLGGKATTANTETIGTTDTEAIGSNNIADGTGTGGVVVNISKFGRALTGTPTVSHKNSSGTVISGASVVITDADGDPSTAGSPTVTVTLGTNRAAGDVIVVTFDEAGPKSGVTILGKGIALIDGALLTSITNRRVASSPATHQFTDASSLTAVITALNTSDPSVTDDTSTTTVDESKNVAGADWITNTAVPLGFVSLTAGGTQATAGNGVVTWKQLASITLGVSDTDTVTVTYSDANGTAQTKTIVVDLSKPTITGATPAKNSATNTTIPQLKATVADIGAGFDTTNLTNSLTMTLTPSGGSASTVTFSAVGTGSGSFDLTAVPGSALAVTTGHSWKLVATDKVGNTTTTGDLTFAVDNVSPTLTSAKTGIGLKLTTGKTDEYEEFASSSWIKLTFSEKVDTTSVAALDFDIVGSSPPDSIMVQKKVKQLGGALETDRRDFIYLKASAALDAAARPKVTITGAIADIAGNSAPTGTATGASATPSDSIKPTLTVTTDVTLGKNKEKVVITVTSNEALLGDVPSIKVDGAGVATTKTGTNAWSATYTIGTTSTEQTVTADGSDSAGNAATQKTKKFQADVNKPTLAFQDAGATNVFAAGGNRDVNSVTAGLQVEIDDVIFIPITADDVTPDSYVTGTDTHKKVTITTAKLDTLDKLTGVSPAPVVQSTVTLSDSDFQSTNGINFVYGASGLGIGFYKLTITATDEAGNLMTTAASREFQVVAQKATSIGVNPGWTLISLQGRPQDRSITSVLDGTTVTQVWSFNNTAQVWEFAGLNDGVWEGTLTQITDGRAYFVRSSTFDPIKVLLERFSPQRSQPQYVVTRGWNGVGYTAGGTETRALTGAYLSSLAGGGTDAGWGVLRWWNSTLQRYESAWPTGAFTAGFPTEATTADANGDGDTADGPVVEAGKGYLLYATRGGVLAP